MPSQETLLVKIVVQSLLTPLVCSKIISKLPIYLNYVIHEIIITNHNSTTHQIIK